MPTLTTESRTHQCCFDYCSRVIHAFQNVGNWTGEIVNPSLKEGGFFFLINKVITVPTDFFTHTFMICTDVATQSFHNVGRWLDDLIKRAAAVFSLLFSTPPSPSNTLSTESASPREDQPHVSSSARRRKDPPKRRRGNKRISDLELFSRYMKRRYAEEETAKAAAVALATTSLPSLHPPPASTNRLQRNPQHAQKKRRDHRKHSSWDRRAPITASQTIELSLEENGVFISHRHKSWYHRLKSNPPRAIIQLLSEISGVEGASAKQPSHEASIVRVKTFYRLSYLQSIVPLMDQDNFDLSLEAIQLFFSLPRHIQSALVGYYLITPQEDWNGTIPQGMLTSPHLPAHITSTIEALDLT